MAGQQQEMDANEPATAHKLAKAHERGSVVRSAEVNFAAVLLVCVACVFGLGARVLGDLARMMTVALASAGQPDLRSASALRLVEILATGALTAIAPICLLVWIAAATSAGMQAGGVLSAQPLLPDLDRLNPVKGLQRLMSLRALNELWRNVAKLLAIGGGMALWGSHQLPRFVRMSALTTGAIAMEAIASLGSALMLLSAIAIVFALLDWLFNRWYFMREMRMSRREIKDERKEREGDPRIKARLRELRLEWLKRAGQLSRVRDADVLLTNPTHYAVALEYRREGMPAPMISARGEGELAARMRLEAIRRGVPIVQNAPLARALFALRDKQALVPQEHFAEVARILRWVYSARGNVGAREAKP